MVIWVVEDVSEGPVQETPALKGKTVPVLQIGDVGGRDWSSEGRYGERWADSTDSLLLGDEICN